MLEGYATHEATANLKQQFPESHQAYWKTLGKTGLINSSYGFGCYRVHDKSFQHNEALTRVLLLGCNLIDTSSNYGDGGSERLVGKVLSELIDSGRRTREEIIVVSKVGYVQGNNMTVTLEREKQGKPFPEMVYFSSDCWHCIHPEFLEDQLERSLQRLNLKTIDIYLLHNPEYFLKAEKKNHQSMTDLRDEYYRRIKESFTWLEEQVTKGRIKSYGISSNTFPEVSSSHDFTSLERVLSIAQSIKKDHSFTTIQFPLNLLEHGAVIHLNQAEKTKSLLTFAFENNIATLVNRPLNAFSPKGLIRLADFRLVDKETFGKEIQALGNTLIELESYFRKHLMNLDEFKDLNKNIFNNVRICETLYSNYINFDGLEHWKSTLEYYILPPFGHTISLLKEKANGNKDFNNWVSGYKDKTARFIDLITQLYESSAHQRSSLMKEVLLKVEPDINTIDTFSQMALHSISSLKEISCVLVGMRTVDYVDDVLSLMIQAPLPESKKIFEAFDHVVVGV